MEFHVGFTGTQTGMDDMQVFAVAQRLRTLFGEGYTYFHHGDCIGADTQAHKIALSIGYQIIIHPCDIENKRAYCKDAVWIHPMHPPLQRNHDIVNDSAVLIAAPKEREPILCSGTWATWRYATKCKRVIYLYLPGEE